MIYLCEDFVKLLEQTMATICRKISENRNHSWIRCCYFAIYLIIFSFSMMYFVLGCLIDSKNIIIFLILIFCFLLPLSIVISAKEIQTPNQKLPSKPHDDIDFPISHFYQPLLIEKSIKNTDFNGWCMVCKLEIDFNELTLECPECEAKAHKLHLLEWVKIKGYCPHCGAILKYMNFMDVIDSTNLNWIEI